MSHPSGATRLAAVSALIAGAFCLGIVLTTACSEQAATTRPSPIGPLAGGGEGVLGITATATAGTSVPAPPPPPSPPPPPRPDDPPPQPPPDDDGRVRLHGILLAQDQLCPGCVVTLRMGQAFIPEDAELFGGEILEDIPITFDELNDALMPGQPLRILAEPDPSGGIPVALSVRVEHIISTTGTIDVSSRELARLREFTLGVFSGSTGRVEFTMRLTPDATLGEFEAHERVYVVGFARDGQLFARFVRRDE